MTFKKILNDTKLKVNENKDERWKQSKNQYLTHLTLVYHANIEYIYE